MSFNFGPTLLEWMENAYPMVYQRIIDADHVSKASNNGHGNAIGQVYNHVIMPLCNRRDKELQVAWGRHDFKWRFGREPEAMWLGETAINTETLQVLAEQDMKYVILSPYQALKVKDMHSNHEWDVGHSNIDPTEPYLIDLGNNKKICAFFYDGPVSAQVGFQHLLRNSEVFAASLKRCVNGGKIDRNEQHVVNTAWDGETAGWHEQYGNRALAYLFYNMKGFEMRFTNYAAYLENHPPKKIVTVRENSAWSDFDGISRWGGPGNGKMGIPDGFDPSWRRQLRDTLNWLRDQLDTLYDTNVKGIIKDPWEARKDYLDVKNRRMSINEFFLKHGAHPVMNVQDKTKALDLLDMQKNAQLMFTSCGWFFEDISRIEPMQNLTYASRAIQLAGRHVKNNLEEQLLCMLGGIKSNCQNKNARMLYEEQIATKIEQRGFRFRKKWNIKMHESMVQEYEEEHDALYKMAQSGKNLDQDKIEKYEMTMNAALRKYTADLSDFQGYDPAPKIKDLFYIAKQIGLTFHVIDTGRANVYDALRRMSYDITRKVSCRQKGQMQRYSSMIEVAKLFDFNTTKYEDLLKQYTP